MDRPFAIDRRERPRLMSVLPLGAGNMLEDSVFTWRFSARSGDNWGGTLIADSMAFDPGDSVQTAFGTYLIQLEQAFGENRARTKESADAGILDFKNTMAVVTRLYNATLGRDPDLGGAPNSGRGR